MTDKLVIQIDAERANRWFGELLRRGGNLSGLMSEIGENLLTSTKARFNTGIAPDGTEWAALKDGSGRSPLLDTGTMQSQIFPESGDDWVEISATAKQARWHQEGTAGPYEIRPKAGKALNWPGGPGPRAKVTHPGLPPRPFMGLSAEDEQTIDALAVAWLDLTPEAS